MQLNEIDDVDAEVAPTAIDPAAEGRQGVGRGDMRVGAAAHLGRHHQPGVISLGQEPPDDRLAVRRRRRRRCPRT